MKKSLFAMLAAAVLAVACTEESKVTSDPKLTVDGLTLNDNHGVNVEAAVSTVDFTVNANVAYTIVSDQEWATPAPAKVENADNKEIKTDIKVNIEANASEESRSAKISIVVDGHNELNYEFTISQAAAVYEKTLAVLAENLEPVTEPVEADGEIESTVTLVVASTVSWTATSDQTWLTVTPESAAVENYAQTSTTVKLNIAVNDTKEARTAKVVFSSEDAEDVEITVNQTENIPFEAVIEAMSVSEFNPSLVEKYPEESSIAIYIGDATAEVVSGYYGGWKASSWEDLTSDWDNNIENAKERLTSYGSAMSDVNLGYINDPDRGYLGSVFYSLEPDTDYILVAMLQDAKGRVYINYSIARTKAETPVEYNGFLKIGKYKLSCGTGGNQSLTTMTIKYEGEENKYSVKDLAIDDGSSWHADYNPSAKTLTISGIEKGYEDDGNIFGQLYGYWNKANYLMYAYMSFATENDEEGDSPVVFSVDDNGYLSALNTYLYGVVVYQMDSSFDNITKVLGWGAMFFAEETTVTYEAAAASPASAKFETAGKMADLDAPKAKGISCKGIKMVDKLYR